MNEPDLWVGTRMTVTGCSTVLGEIGVLRACADSLNETAATSSTAGGINALSWEDALRALDGLRIAVETLAQIDAALVRHTYLVAPHGDIEVDGIGVVSVRRSNDRKEWQHDDWKHDVRGAILDDLNCGDAVFTLDGEAVDLMELITKVQSVHGAQAPKVTALRALGLDPQAYCHEVPGKPTVTITRSSK